MEKITQIQGLNIYQSLKLQSFTLDSVLLADFVNINRKSKKMLEIGTGCGIISMLISNKIKSNNNILNIDAVEILSDSCDIAKKNLRENNITNINIFNEDIKKYRINDNQIYDIVVSNPPYFKVEKKASQMKKDINIINARNENTLSIKETIEVSSRLLKNNGHLYLIFRTDDLVRVLEYVKEFKMSAKHMKLVYTTENKDSLITILDIVKSRTDQLHIQRPIYIYENGEKTSYIQNLYRK